MTAKEKELVELKAKIEKMRSRIHGPLHKLAFDKTVNHNEETNEKFNILLDECWNLIAMAK